MYSLKNAEDLFFVVHKNPYSNLLFQESDDEDDDDDSLEGSADRLLVF